MKLSARDKTNNVSRYGFAAGLGSIAFLPAVARAAQFEFKCGSPLPIGHPQAIRGTQMWNAVEKESNGRIHVRFFPNSVLGSDQAQFTQLRAGALEFFFLSTSTAQNVVPPADIAELGFAF